MLQLQILGLIFYIKLQYFIKFIDGNWLFACFSRYSGSISCTNSICVKEILHLLIICYRTYLQLMVVGLFGLPGLPVVVQSAVLLALSIRETVPVLIQNHLVMVHLALGLRFKNLFLVNLSKCNNKPAISGSEV